MALGMFTKLCLALLLLPSGSLVPKISLSMNEKKLERSLENGWTEYNLEDGMTALA